MGEILILQTPSDMFTACEYRALTNQIVASSYQNAGNMIVLYTASVANVVEMTKCSLSFSQQTECGVRNKTTCAFQSAAYSIVKLDTL